MKRLIRSLVVNLSYQVSIASRYHNIFETHGYSWLCSRSSATGSHRLPTTEADSSTKFLTLFFRSFADCSGVEHGYERADDDIPLARAMI
jgi:hypothetical protein